MTSFINYLLYLKLTGSKFYELTQFFLGRKEGRLPSPIRKGFCMSTQSTNQRVSKLSNKIVPSGLEPELTLLGPTALFVITLILTFQFDFPQDSLVRM